MNFIMELIRTCNFTLATGTGRKGRQRRPRNHQEIVIIGISSFKHLRIRLSHYEYHYKEIAFANDVTINMHSSKNWMALENAFSQDMENLSSYFQK